MSTLIKSGFGFSSLENKKIKVDLIETEDGYGFYQDDELIDFVDENLIKDLFDEVGEKSSDYIESDMYIRLFDIYVGVDFS